MAFAIKCILGQVRCWFGGADHKSRPYKEDLYGGSKGSINACQCVCFQILCRVQHHFLGPRTESSDAKYINVVQGL